MRNKKILIIEDEKAIADLIYYGIKKDGGLPLIAESCKKAMESLAEFNPELVLLDLMLPDGDGLDLCKFISLNYSIPIIIVTAKSDTIDKILGLEFGADDYITKPFNLKEVLTRIKVIFRRINKAQTYITQCKDSYVSIGLGIEINEAAHSVKKDGKEVILTPKEFVLLLELYNNRGQVLSRDKLLENVWGYDYLGDTRTVDIHIQRIRKKLDSKLVETIYGFGYKIINMD